MYCKGSIIATNAISSGMYHLQAIEQCLTIVGSVCTDPLSRLETRISLVSGVLLALSMLKLIGRIKDDKAAIELDVDRLLD